MAKLYVCGEALIDFVPSQSLDGKPAFLAETGGSPFNAARAAARAGASVAFIGGLSTDMFGDRLRADLTADGVDCTLAEFSDAPTTLAFVDLSSGSPRYAFYTTGTATQRMAPNAAALSPGSLDILNVGSVSLIETPGADNVAAFCEEMAARMRISIDVNARPSMTKDRDAWLSRIERICDVAQVIKVSDEDLDFMYPGQDPQTFVDARIAAGAALVVITYGARGAHAHTRQGLARVSPPQIVLADSVGAGDALMGAMLAWLLDRPEAEPMADLSQDAMTEMLRFATTGAAINCTRVGANPPTRAEIQAMLSV